MERKPVTLPGSIERFISDLLGYQNPSVSFSALQIGYNELLIARNLLYVHNLHEAEAFRFPAHHSLNDLVSGVYFSFGECGIEARPDSGMNERSTSLEMTYLPRRGSIAGSNEMQFRQALQRGQAALLKQYEGVPIHA